MPLSANRLLAVIEPLLYGRRGRPWCLALLLALSAALLVQALRIQPDAGFEKSIPLEHPYMQVFKQYQQQFGGANSLLVAVMLKPGSKYPDLYNEPFLATLRDATQEVFFTQAVDRAQVRSIFTRNVRYFDEQTGEAGDVVPADYTPTPEVFGQIRQHVIKAGVIGRLVTADERGAMISAEVLERSPVSGRRTDHVAVAHALEDGVRQRFLQPRKFLYRLKAAQAPFAAGDVVAETFQAPSWLARFGHVHGDKQLPGGDHAEADFGMNQLSVEEVANPQYNPDVEIHMIGFTTFVGDVSDAVGEVAGFFALTVVGTMLALWWYLGSLRLAWLPLGCSLTAVVWEFGLLRSFGYGLDPFAIMVPFLVLAVSTSHGVQYVNTWADEVAQGGDGFEASRRTFRRLFIPGSIALFTNVAGFLTIYLVPIGSIREMSINACLGMLAVIATNKLLMPIWLSYISVGNVERFRRRRRARLNAGDRLWRLLSGVTERPVAAALIALSLLVLAGSWLYQGRRIVGDVQAGAAELTPDSVYNRDVAAISGGFGIGTDVLKVIAEADAEACVRYEVLDQLERFTWFMRNVPGVSYTYSLTDYMRQANAALQEHNPRFAVVPRNRDLLATINLGVSTTTGLFDYHCSAMPVLVFVANHKAAMIAAMVQAMSGFEARNAAQFYAAHHDVDAAYCAHKTELRRAIGAAAQRLEDHRARLLERGLGDEAPGADPGTQALAAALDAATQAYAAEDRSCPLHFAIGSGNVAVMAATNAVVRDKELETILWVYAVIALLVWLSYRSLPGLLVIGIPLFSVSIFANALMAWFGIGLKVATLPVITLAVGIGVDYGIYIYDRLRHYAQVEGLPLREAYFRTLQKTGKAVIFTGLCLAGGVATWLWSPLQFQRDMGRLLVFMFSANMLGAVLLCPAYYRFVMRPPRA
jgi:predicted RND superfamily exporter protein